LKGEETERERRLRETLDRISQAEQRAAEAEQRAREAVSGIADLGSEAEPPPPAPPPPPTPRSAAKPEPQSPPPAPRPAAIPEPKPSAPPSPSKPEPDPPKADLAAPSSAAAAPISLNQATYDQLRGLKLSVTQTGRVLDYRERVGGFKSLDELDDIVGFPRDLLDELKRKLTL
jgi:hypothetical protein